LLPATGGPSLILPTTLAQEGRIAAVFWRCLALRAGSEVLRTLLLNSSVNKACGAASRCQPAYASVSSTLDAPSPSRTWNLSSGQFCVSGVARYRCTSPMRHAAYTSPPPLQIVAGAPCLQPREGPYLDLRRLPMHSLTCVHGSSSLIGTWGNKPVCGGSGRNQRRNEARLVHGGGLAVTVGQESSTRRRCWHPSKIRASTDSVAQTWWFFLPTRLLRGGGARSIRCRPCP
jgi:hypothetical protein